MTLCHKLIALAFALTTFSSSDAQQILFSNGAAYLDSSTNPATPRVTMNGYTNSVTVSGDTYKNVGMVLSHSYSTFNDVFNPAANAPGTTFGYAKNSPFGTLPASSTWHADIPLPVTTISSDPSNPTYITVSFYLVDNKGNPYNNAPFSTYCFMTYISAGKVITSPAGGPYSNVVPPSGIGLGMERKSGKDSQVSTKAKAKNRTLPPPSALNMTPNSDREIRGTIPPVPAQVLTMLTHPRALKASVLVG